MYWKTNLGPDVKRETSHGASGESRVPHLKSRRAHLLTTRSRVVVLPSAAVRSPRGMRRLRTPSANAALPAGMSVIGCAVEAHFPC